MKVVPADKATIRLSAGQPFTPTINGYFVSDARMLDILNALDRARIREQSK